ncbi:hypothetical protein Aca07nite_57120 [Actinoplanes capillaceus]|uniref:Ig-like domain (Group 3) n=1 Tax=Actinoplanes campanulatus TaxID=113559 RepID=A0ABQ3WQG6_9ACTN|nr:hypothetical protein [Actinoplanes capillaceus]GID48437.1 hypothetical protein Aca07nite_57120 [Actinoplanes capillaceus]
MRTKSLTMLTTALATAAVLTPNAAVAAPRKPVKMRFAASATATLRGSTVNLTGRAHYKATGNKARVDIYFAQTGAGYRLLTSTTANAHGDFRKSVTATTTGTYKAVYRGNTKRKRATAADTLTVYINQTVTRTLFSHTEDDADCYAAKPNACTFSGPAITIANTPITVTGTVACDRPKPSMGVRFTDSPDSPKPPHIPGNTLAGPGWVVAYYHGLGTVTMPTPPSATGAFHVNVTSGAYAGGETTSCDWSVTAKQDVTERVTV